MKTTEGYIMYVNFVCKNQSGRDIFIDFLNLNDKTNELLAYYNKDAWHYKKGRKVALSDFHFIEDFRTNLICAGFDSNIVRKVEFSEATSQTCHYIAFDYPKGFVSDYWKVARLMCLKQQKISAKDIKYLDFVE